jgi:eukaryotic-like serine/threonine-protein kinase
MSQPDQTSASTDTPLNWGQPSPAPRARDLTGASLGDFQVDKLLGRGGMGEVYLARQNSLNRLVALKVLRPDLTNPTYLSRFEAEAWSAAKLNHPNIVHIYSLGIFEGLRFIAMEYVQGTNLREYLLKKGTPDLAVSLSIMRQAGAAVGAAGEVGLVHRDIKPENLLLTKKGQVKVADFGLCRNLDDDRHHVTQPGVTMGTPLYMSPEQARGQAMDHRSDLYSLGVTYYHMLAGQPPFRADNALALAMKHVVDTPVDLSVHRPDLPLDVCKLVMKLMSKAPADRYQSASEMLRDLGKIRESLQVSAFAAASGVAVIDTTPREVFSLVDPNSKSRSKSSAKPVVGPLPGESLLVRPRTAFLIAASIVGLLVGALAGWYARPADLLGADRSPNHAPPALWIAPDWERIEQKESAASQYRYAQIQESPADRQAAFVAVSGYFPADADWTSRSYIQLARELFRSRDLERLKALAEVLGTDHYGRNEKLTPIINLAVAALGSGDAEKYAAYFDESNYAIVPNMLDPGIVDFGLEIALRLKEDSKRFSLTRTVLERVTEVQGHLIRRLMEIKKKDHQG